MKKKTFMMICLAILGIQVSKAQQSIIALHHEGNVTIFAGSKTQEAMDASVKGDTLYLSEGTFAGWNVTHGIVVLGSGERTVVSGNINITGNDEKKDIGGYVFSGLNLIHDFAVCDSINGLRISQCQMRHFWVNDAFFLDNSEIAMSKIRNIFYVGGDEVGLDVLNSIISEVHYAGRTYGSVTFNHCNIGWAQRYNTNDYGKYNTYINCILHRVDQATCYYCLYDEEYDSPSLTNCYNLNFDCNENLSPSHLSE